MQQFETRLSGGHHNSLGNTIEVVESVLADPSRFEELFNCYFSDDEVVRLRTSSALKRICKANKSLLLPYIDRLLNDISQINQASTQWTLAQLFDLLKEDMTISQREQAKIIMQVNLEEHQDWIVLNTSMETLMNWAKENTDLRVWLVPQLQRLRGDKRKSVSKRANKFLAKLQA
jgi:hypothetical protein